MWSGFYQSVTLVLTWIQKLMMLEKGTMDLSPKWQTRVVKPTEPSSPYSSDNRGSHNTWQLVTKGGSVFLAI